MPNAAKFAMLVLLLGVVIVGYGGQCQMTSGVEAGSSQAVNQKNLQPFSTTSIAPVNNETNSTVAVFYPNSPFFPNLKLESSQPIELTPEIDAKTVAFLIWPVSVTQGTETIITISGLEPFWAGKPAPIPLFRHQDGFFVEQFTVDPKGRYTWTQQLDSEKAVHIYILPDKGTLYIGYEANGQIPPYPPYLYNYSNRTYTLNRNINEPVVIIANNITLDGSINNHTISGPGSGYGIYVNAYSAVTITRCTVQNFTEGIRVLNSSGDTLSGNILRQNSQVGIYLWPDADWNKVMGNQATSNGYGIADSSDYNIIADNTANLNSIGIEVWKSFYPIVTGNTVTSNGTGFNIGRTPYDVTLADNTVTLNTAVGINLYYNTGLCYIYHNNIYSNALNIYSTYPTGFSYNNEGNWWGHTRPPGFYIYGQANTPYDSNSAVVVDSWPYLVKDGWKHGFLPKKYETTPPVITTTTLTPLPGAIITSLRPLISAEYYDPDMGIFGNYRMPVTIVNGATTLTDYAIKVNITYNHNMQSDFDDIRFADSNNNELSYWITNKTDYISAIAWVKIPVLSDNSTTTIYMHYGNPSAASHSSGTGTFEFFDDFSSGFNDAKWEKYSTGSGMVFVQDGVLHIYAGNGNAVGWAKSKVNLPNKIVIETRQKVVRYNDYTLGTLRILNSTSGAEVAGVVYDYFFERGSPGQPWYGWYVNRNSFAPLPLPIPNVPVKNLTPYWNDTWFTQKLYYDGTSSTNNVKYVRDRGMGEESIVHTATATSENLKIIFQPWCYWSQPNNRFYIDYIYVRQYVTTEEPSVSLGAQEQLFSSGINLSSVKIFLDYAVVPATVTANKVFYTPLYPGLSVGEHTIQVQVSDNAGNQTSQQWLFTVAAGNQAPNIPTDPIPPHNAFVTATPTFSVRVSDPDNDNVQAYFVISGVTNSGWVPAAAVPSGSIITWTPSVLLDGVYQWRAQARDTYGAVGNWSAYWTVTTDATAPTIVITTTSVTVNEDFGSTTLNLGNSYDNLTASKDLVWGIKNITFANFTYPSGVFSAVVLSNTLTISAPANVNGSGYFDLTLTDLAGCIATRTVAVTITAFNDPPNIILSEPGMSPGEILSGTRDIRWFAIDEEEAVINIYYNLAGGTWLALAENLPNTGSYSWNTASVRDGNRYKIRVDVVEQSTPEKYTTSVSSTNYFTIDNYPLVITCYAPVPLYIRGDGIDTLRLPFELSEPAFNVYVYITGYSTPIADPLTLDAGIYSVLYDGRNPDVPGTYLLTYTFGLTFKVTATDYQLNTVSQTSTKPFGITKKNMFSNVTDSPDPLYTNESTISFTVTPYQIGGKVGTGLKIMDARGNLGGEYSYLLSAGDYSVKWSYAGTITENRIFSYKISDSSFAGFPADSKTATPVTGTITVLKPDTQIIQSLDLSATVYARPSSASVTITPKAEIASGITYALGSLSIAPPYTYPVSPFYDITATGVATPTIIAIKYPSYLNPQYIKLFRYNPDNNTLVAITRTVIDAANYTLYAEVDTLSLFVLMANPDEAKPTIENLLLTPNTLNFSLADDLSGINIPSINVILDGQDITDKLIISGNTGDLLVNVTGKDIFTPSFDRHTMSITAQDRGGNFVTKTISFTSGYMDVKVVIKPESLNINPGVLTAYLKLPATFGIPITLDATLDGGILDKWMVDYDGIAEEGIEGPVVVMKFRRQDVEKALAEKGEALDTEFILTGTFNDGSAPLGQPYTFEGRDSITKIIPASPFPTPSVRDGAGGSDETPPTGPPEQPKGGTKK